MRHLPAYEAGASFSQDWEETGLPKRRPYSMDKGALNNVYCLQTKGGMDDEVDKQPFLLVREILLKPFKGQGRGLKIDSRACQLSPWHRPLSTVFPERHQHLVNPLPISPAQASYLNALPNIGVLPMQLPQCLGWVSQIARLCNKVRIQAFLLSLDTCAIYF